MWSCMPGGLREVVPSFKFRQNRLNSFRHLGGRNLPFPILKASGLYNSLYYRTSRDRLDVRPSVRPSVRHTLALYQTAERIVMISSPHDSTFILVLCIPRCSRNSDGVTPCGGAQYRWGIKFARFSTNKSLYLANDTIYHYGCYGRQIGTHTRSIKWCHFQ